MAVCHNEVGILFLHHEFTEVVQRHYDLVRYHNPDALVIPIASGRTFVPGSHLLTVEDGLWYQHGRHNPKWYADLMIYQWYERRQYFCRKWIIVEYDTRCNIAFRDFFQDVWDQPAVAPTVYIPSADPAWHWFSADATAIPVHMRHNMAGMSPMSCLLFADNVLDAMVSTFRIRIFHANNELRLGTLAKHVGAMPVAVPHIKGKVVWQLFDDDPTQPGIWHPVKVAS